MRHSPGKTQTVVDLYKNPLFCQLLSVVKGGLLHHSCLPVLRQRALAALDNVRKSNTKKPLNRYEYAIIQNIKLRRTNYVHNMHKQFKVIRLFLRYTQLIYIYVYLTSPKIFM
jgi:hypothetical protein